MSKHTHSIKIPVDEKRFARMEKGITTLEGQVQELLDRDEDGIDLEQLVSNLKIRANEEQDQMEFQVIMMSLDTTFKVVVVSIAVNIIF